VYVAGYDTFGIQQLNGQSSHGKTTIIRKVCSWILV